MKKTVSIFLYTLVLFCNFYAVFTEEDLSVKINDLGRVKGSFLTTRLGKKIFSFRGVRYAEPPTGKLRFQVKESEINFAFPKLI